MNREFNFEQAMKRYEYDTQVQAIQLRYADESV